MDNGEDGGSEQPDSLNIGQSLALRKMMEIVEPAVMKIIPRALKPMVISILQEVIGPIVEVSLRKVVQEEIQKFQENLLTGGTRNDLPKERGLQLKFLDEAPDTVQTGKELRGKKGEFLGLALFDANKRVTCGPESSARVEIVLLDASDNHDGNNTTPENFERRIITEGDKEKPHFAKIVLINLVEGAGILNGLKLGHGEKWTKSCNCRLGARIVQNFVVQKAWTAPFKVIDKRSKHFEKHDSPLSSSEVWRLKGIGRDGEPFRRLMKKNIKTVTDFLFWCTVNPKELQEKILCVGDGAWKKILAHAQKCDIDEKKMYSHESSTEPKMRVIYDAVGNLKGVINKSHFVPIDNLSAAKKVRACKLLRSVLKEASAFGERYDISFEDEDSLLKEFPYRSSDTNASTNSSLQHGGLTVSEDMSEYQTTERGSSSQSTIDPNNNSYGSGHSDSLGSKEMGELSNTSSGPSPDPQINCEGGGPLTYLDSETPFPYDIIVEDPGLRFENHSSSISFLLSEEYKASADDQLSASPGRNWRNVNPYNDGLGAEMVRESSIGRSNASFLSTREQWFADDPYYPGPPSPDPMLHFAADEASAAAASQVADQPRGWKKLSRLWFSLSEWMSTDASRSRKKRRVG